VFLALSSCSYLNRKTRKLEVQPKSGSQANGTIKILERNGKVKAKLNIKGLKPNNEHGFHIHENGDCSCAEGKSAGGHYAPNMMNHGGPSDMKYHLGDLGNLKSDAQGKIEQTILLKGVSLESNKMNSILNRSFVLHASKDDFKTQPSGNSGERIACAVIK
jgi:Cu-Zn family superoxide dismutase